MQPERSDSTPEPPIRATPRAIVHTARIRTPNREATRNVYDSVYGSQFGRLRKRRRQEGREKRAINCSVTLAGMMLRSGFA